LFAPDDIQQSTDVADLEAAYPWLTPVLFGVLGRLAQTGFVVAPADARDLIHDFYLEAWAGLKKRYKPDLASFEAYASGAFVQFVRPRIVRLSRMRTISDPLLLESLRSREPWPDQRADDSALWIALSDAVDHLPEDMKEVLLAYCYAGASERALARRLCTSRYKLRERLIDALGQVVVLLPKPPSIAAKDWEVGRAIWRDRRTVAQAARILGITDHQARTAHERCVRVLSGVLRNIEKSQRSDEMPIKSDKNRTSLEILGETLASPGNKQMLEEVRDHAAEILKLLSEADDDAFETLDPAAIDAEWAAHVYGALATSEAEKIIAGDAEYLRPLFEARQEDLRSIGDAFERALLPDLPEELKAFEICFCQIKTVGEDRSKALLEQADVQASTSARGMVAYGITPHTVLIASNAVSRLADRMIARGFLKSDMPLLLSVDNVTRLERQRLDYFLVVNEVERATRCNPATSESLLRWCIGLAQYKPLFFDGFQADPETRFGVTLRVTGGEEHDLFVRWGRAEPRLPLAEADPPANERQPVHSPSSRKSRSASA